MVKHLRPSSRLWCALVAANNEVCRFCYFCLPFNRECLLDRRLRPGPFYGLIHETEGGCVLEPSSLDSLSFIATSNKIQ